MVGEQKSMRVLDADGMEIGVARFEEDHLVVSFDLTGYIPIGDLPARP